MYLSLNWLKDFVDIPNKITPDELGRLFTMHTVEIDDVIKQSEKFSEVVVGQIKEISKHPNADRLQLAKVNIGKEVLGIVCGAPNIAVGQLVPVALVGAVLPNGLEIKETEVRGEKSCGMLCAEDELGLGNDHAGIMILDKRAKVGQKFSDYLRLKDTIFEVDNKSITHRSDLWGHIGMAREVATFLNSNTTKEFKRILDNKIKIDKEEVKVNAKVTAADLCPRYMAVAMKGIKIEESPAWMQERLVAAGVRPINNIVDITNYVMLELGQPMHAFDLRDVDKIVVRRPKKNEIIKTLDGEKRKLTEDMLVIADSQKPIAIAGVMGGENSEVKADTTAIVFEAANFEFSSIRKTSTALGLRTESSVRFEKGLDPNLCEIALARAIELTKKLCSSARVASQVADEKNFVLNQGPIEFSLEWLNQVLGVELEEKKVKNILDSLGFETKIAKGRLTVIIPTWRAVKDVSIKEDIAEEVARILGYDNIEPQLPRVAMEIPEGNEEIKMRRKIKEVLALGAQMTESYNYSFVDEDQLEKVGVNHSQFIRLANPIASHQTILRQNLATNLLGNVKTNQARFEEIKMFEIGSVYLSHSGELSKGGKSEEKLPYQEKRAGLILARSKNKDLFIDIKGLVEYLLETFNLQVEFSLNEAIPYWADKNEAAQINVQDKMIGTILKLDKNTKAKLGIKKEVFVAEISLKELFKIVNGQTVKKYQEYEKYPPVIRDLAVVVSENKLYTDIIKTMTACHEYIKQIELFDVYQGEKLGKGKKSLAFHIIYQTDKTLTAEEVDKIQKELVKVLEKKFEAKVRDF